jgi:hypothetical protein
LWHLRLDQLVVVDFIHVDDLGLELGAIGWNGSLELSVRLAIEVVCATPFNSFPDENLFDFGNLFCMLLVLAVQQFVPC